MVERVEKKLFDHASMERYHFHRKEICAPKDCPLHPWLGGIDFRYQNAFGDQLDFSVWHDHDSFFNVFVVQHGPTMTRSRVGCHFRDLARKTLELADFYWKVDKFTTLSGMRLDGTAKS